jgi:hypothetical protein
MIEGGLVLIGPFGGETKVGFFTDYAADEGKADGPPVGLMPQYISMVFPRQRRFFFAFSESGNELFITALFSLLVTMGG